MPEDSTADWAYSVFLATLLCEQSDGLAEGEQDRERYDTQICDRI